MSPLERVAETNWFFRLSAYQDHLEHLITSGELEIHPRQYRDEVLAFVRGGLEDISVSRTVDRARGWGIPVPDDPDQVVYVWFDALTNYLSSLDFGDPDSVAYRRWWLDAERRVHVIGKGITRFHAVYWPAFLASAGQPAPTRIEVHPYLTVDGAKISKSATPASGARPGPADVAERFGTDAAALVVRPRRVIDVGHRLHGTAARRPGERRPRQRRRQRRQPGRVADPSVRRRPGDRA